MTLKEYYAAAGGDYIEVFGALGKEERIMKYLRKFAESNMPGKIKEALESKDYETAFREAHNLKGMCMNIAIMKLGEYSSDLTEGLRHGPTDDVEALLALVEAEYTRVRDLVAQID